MTRRALAALAGFRKLWYWYGLRLRRHWAQELLALLGIAVGVALVFSVQIANSSITSSAGEIVEGISGTATLQLSARGSDGMPAETFDEVAALPAVEHAAPVLQQRATLVHDGRTAAVDLVGVDRSLPALGGIAAQNFQVGGLLLQPGLVLPEAVRRELDLPAASTGARLPRVTVSTRGRVAETSVNAVAGEAVVGQLSEALVAVASLPYTQRLTGLEGRITRVLVAPRPGQEEQARVQLAGIAGDRLTVAPVDREIQLLEQAAAPNDQATSLFAAISALVGFLLALNAMLLTVPERRRQVSAFRKLGVRRRKVALILGFQSVVLGCAASLAGLVLGYGMAQIAAREAPSYLTFAFPLGVHPIFDWTALAIAFAGGVLATCVAAAQPLLDLRHRYPVLDGLQGPGQPGHQLSPRVRRNMGLTALGLVLLTTVLVLVQPKLTVVGTGMLAAATVLAIPVVFALVLRGADLVSRGGRVNALLLGTRELRATTVRSLALAATGAVAVFGSVAIEGARSNLITGLDRNSVDFLSTADVWVTAGGDENGLTAQSFDVGDAERRIRANPAVTDVRRYVGGMIDLDDRRAAMAGRPGDDEALVPPSQLRTGSVAQADARLREGGWIAVSETIAETQDADVGDPITLPTPTGDQSFRVAALLTNLGWAPGTVILSADDVRRAWATQSPSALEVDVRDGADPELVAAELRRSIGSDRLSVQTSAQRLVQYRRLADQGLQRLGQIALLLLIAAALAMAAAMAAGMWERRIEFGQQRAHGFRPGNLWRRLLSESLLVLLTACATGAILGTYGHALSSRFLQISTGYPAPFSATPVQTIAACGLVALVALAITGIVGAVVARTPVRLGLTTVT